MIPHEPTEEEVRAWLSSCPYPDPHPSTGPRAFQGVSEYRGTLADNTAATRRQIVIDAIRAGFEPWGKTGGAA